MISDRLAIQSWCFRNFPERERLAELLRECSVNRVELCGLHLNLENPLEDVKKYFKRGIVLTSYGVHGFTDNEPEAERVFGALDSAGIFIVSASFDPGILPMINRLAKKYNKRVAIHNHGRNDPIGSPDVLEKMLAESEPHIGLCVDTAWMIDSGADPVEFIKKFRSRVFNIHVKDFVYDAAGKPEDVIPGEGALDVDELMRFLNESNYTSNFTLEYEGHPENPVPYLSKAVEVLRAADRKNGGKKA